MLHFENRTFSSEPHAERNINLVIIYFQETNMRPHYEHSGYLTEKK